MGCIICFIDHKNKEYNFYFSNKYYEQNVQNNIYHESSSGSEFTNYLMKHFLLMEAASDIYLYICGNVP